MQKPVDQHLENMRHEHARWSAEHGHWSKDLRIWRLEHVKALDACTKIESLVHKFNELVPPLQRDITLHEEEVRLHSKELEFALPGSKHPGEQLHQCGATDHQHERESHETLSALHHQIRAEIARLNESIPPLSFVPPSYKDEVERTAEI